MQASKQILSAVAAVAILAACGGADAPAPAGDSLAMGDSLVPITDQAVLPDTAPPAPAETVYVEKAPAGATTRPKPKPVLNPRPAGSTPAPAPAPVDRTLRLAATTTFSGTAVDSIHSRYNKVGDVVRMRVSADVTDESGKVVIPAGSVVSLAITAIAPAEQKGEKGTLSLSARSVSINGESFPLAARASDYEYVMKARGVGGGEVARTAGGAAAGAIIGKVIGGKTGTVVGAVGGAAAGAAIADKEADRDIIVSAGKTITLALRDEFSRQP
ncbi:MAG TPA: glycine zipper domain-containing protein [Gemmatimonadales bacterium]|nr:glycine zipper domain-containing protein [Gemmatimonadales bacterium]